jgi:hypothetical protein
MMTILMLNYEFPPTGGGAGQTHAVLGRDNTQTSELRVDVATSCWTAGVHTETWETNGHIHRLGIHKKHHHLYGSFPEPAGEAHGKR